MAIYHCSFNPISRRSGRSAVAAAAYRAAETLLCERDGLTHDFKNRTGVLHAEIVLPAGSQSEWAKDRSRLWNAAEFAEKRRDARVANEIEVALPHELSHAERFVLVREFAQSLADRYGVAVDFALHAPQGASDVRNHHAHILLTTRKVEANGLGEKSALEMRASTAKALGIPTSPEQIRQIRLAWEEHANRHLALAGLDIRIDHRSHRKRGLEISPTEHVGVAATELQRRGMATERVRLDPKEAAKNAEKIRGHPEQVLEIVTSEKSVFERKDVERVLRRSVALEEVDRLAATVMGSSALICVQAERRDASGRVISPEKYSTCEIVSIEAGMAERAVAVGRPSCLSEG